MNMMNPQTARVRAEILPVAIAGHGHDDDQRDAAGGERQARGGGVIAQQLLHELRLQDGIGVEHAAHQHHEEATDGEVFEAEKLEVDEGIFLPPLPHHQADHAGDEQERRKKRMKPEANQSFSSPLSSMICRPPMARVRKARPR